MHVWFKSGWLKMGGFYQVVELHQGWSATNGATTFGFYQKSIKAHSLAAALFHINWKFEMIEYIYLFHHFKETYLGDSASTQGNLWVAAQNLCFSWKPLKYANLKTMNLWFGIFYPFCTFFFILVKFTTLLICTI